MLIFDFVEKHSMAGILTYFSQNIKRLCIRIRLTITRQAPVSLSIRGVYGPQWSGNADYDLHHLKLE